MNYYLELLESYSKLKKRSLTLIKEQEEDREVVSTATRAVQVGMGSTGKYIPLSHPDGKQKFSVVKETSQAGNVVIKARFGGYPYGVPIADGMGISTGSQKTGYDELSIWLQSGGQAAAVGGNEEDDKEKSDKNIADAEEQEVADEKEMQRQQENAVRDQQELNKTTLAPIVEDIGYRSDPNDEPESKFEVGYDFFVDDQVSKNAFIKHLEGFVNKLIDDVTIPLPVKEESLNNLKELVGVATGIQTAKLGGGLLDQSLVDRLKAIKKKIGKTGRSGELTLTLEHPTEDADANKLLATDILLIGREAVEGHTEITAKYGRAAPAFSEITKMITNGIQMYNKVIDKRISDEIDTSWHKSRIVRGGTPGEDAVRRCDIDEGLVTAAGIIHSLGGLSDPDRKKGEEDKKAFLKTQLQNSVGLILGADTVAGAAAYLRSGLDELEGVNVRTLLGAEQGDYAAALIDRLVSDVRMDRDEAKMFLEEISEEGLRVIGLSLLFRYNTVKDIFGDVKPLYAVGVGNRGERIKGRKVDNAFVFSPDDADALLAQLNKKTGLTKKSIKGYTEKGSIRSFIKRGILKASDFPKGHDLGRSVLLHRFSLKTHSNDRSDSSQGSAAVSTIVPSVAAKETVKGEDGGDIDNPEYKFREQVKDSVRDVTSEDDQKELYSFLDGCKSDLYKKDGTPKGKPKEQTLKFWGLVQTKIANLKGKKLKNFQKSLATYLLVLGGGSRANQLNVISYSDTGKFSAQDDHAFRADVVEKMKSGVWKLNYSLNENGGIITIGPMVDIQQQVKDDEGKKVWETREKTGKDGKVLKTKKGKAKMERVPKMETVQGIKPMLKVNGKGLRTDVWKDSNYLRDLTQVEDTGLSHIMGQENSSTMLRQFLSAQAKMIQELLATE